jgi:hypothetical protein
VGGSAKALILGEEVAPRVVDALMVRFGFQAHDTGEPKPADAPDNLFAPLDWSRHRPGRVRRRCPAAQPLHGPATAPLVGRIPLAADALAVADSSSGR